MVVLYNWTYCDYLDAYEYTLIQLECRLQDVEDQAELARNP